MYIRNIFFIVTSILCTEGFDFKLKYCRFRCSNSCETPEDKSNPLGSAKPPGAYYWRDFYGAIPTDAYPLGPSTQFPQTYIGLVYDPSKNGTFVTTIYDGLNYVYTVLQNETTKIDKHIQILCTKSPGQLSWVKFTSDNLKTIGATYTNVRGGYHMELVNNARKYFNHFIVKANKCQVTYVGAVYSLNSKLEYALIDGKHDITDQFLWLMYKKEGPANNPGTSGPSPSKSFFSHHNEYEIRSDSIIPKFYRQITLGSCSITCTNDDKSSMAEIKKNVKLSASMAYYWKPNSVIEKEEAVPAGKDYGGIVYVGQAFLSNDILDVGSSDLKSTRIRLDVANVIESRYYHVLSSNYQEKLKWINTTAQDFSNQDKNKMIPGGAYANGTETFVCREVDKNSILPGSARVLSTGTYCYDKFGPISNFQVLIYDQGKQ